MSADPGPDPGQQLGCSSRANNLYDCSALPCRLDRTFAHSRRSTACRITPFESSYMSRTEIVLATICLCLRSPLPSHLHSRRPCHRTAKGRSNGQRMEVDLPTIAHSISRTSLWPSTQCGANPEFPSWLAMPKSNHITRLLLLINGISHPPHLCPTSDLQALGDKAYFLQVGGIDVPDF